jgi:hypothetical protein
MGRKTKKVKEERRCIKRKQKGRKKAITIEG